MIKPVQLTVKLFLNFKNLNCMSLYSEYRIDSYIVKYVTNKPMILLRGGSILPFTDPHIHYFAELKFYPDDVELPEDYLDQVNRTSYIRLYFRTSDFNNIIDLLRNESPLKFIYTGDGGALANNNGIYTDQEPAGVNDDHPIHEAHLNPGTPV
jgi:hypothetical protein